MQSWLLLARLSIGAVWIYEGLWMKILHPDAHELAIVAHFAPANLGAGALMGAIGALEILLGLGFCSGLWPRLVGWVGFTALLLMNLVGIFGSGEIVAPLGLLIKNGPLWLAMALIATQGAGLWALRSPLANLSKTKHS